MRAVAIPVIACMFALSALVTCLILLSTHQADTLAEQQQRTIVTTIIDQGRQMIAHDQEAATVWDDSVTKLRARPLDLTWIDANLGVWLFTYYGHDRVFILDQNDKPIYAMVEGVRGDPLRYNQLRSTIAPLARSLRHALLHPELEPIRPSVLTPGRIDLASVDGHPAIISVKPVMPDSASVTQRPQDTHLHVSIRYLDGSFASRMARDYALNDGRIVSAATSKPDESAVPLLNNAGKPIGYIMWTPFQPGQAVLTQILPTFVAALLILIVGTTLLLRRLLRNTIALHASEAQAQHLAFHDTLTGLANRALFEDSLDQALASLRETKSSLALLYLDLDRFKAINDTQGHPAGDALIQLVGQRLSEATRSSDTVARLGGDEFAILLTDIHMREDVPQLCERIIQSIAHPFNLEDAQVNIGVSIGIASAPDDALGSAELSRKADIALYQAKEFGRGRYVIFDPLMDEDLRERRAMEAALRGSITENRDLTLHFQPIISARTGEIEGAEALIRWKHPRQGFVSPVQFIPLAEETGLIENLGEWVLRQACLDALHWPLATISVNISPIQLRNPTFAGRALEIISQSGMDPRRIEMEITETCLIDNVLECQPNITLLRAQGVRFALDDFGTGYSSFNHFHQLKFDRLKIDRTFIAPIRSGAPENPIVKAIVELATSAGIAVTAEGVETLFQSHYLARLGCTSLQGFHHGRPMPADQISKMIRIPDIAANG